MIRPIKKTIPIKNLTIRGTFNPVGDKSWKITGALSYPFRDCRDISGICVIARFYYRVYG